MRTAERPRLEVNAQPLRELAQAIELVGERPLQHYTGAANEVRVRA